MGARGRRRCGAHERRGVNPMAMTDDELQVAAEHVWRHWQQGTRMDGLPEHVRPRTRKDGYAVQARLEAHSRLPLFGWKIAATSKAGQAHIAVDGPLAGRLLQERIRSEDDEVPFGSNHMRVAEAEFAFRMRDDLRPRARAYAVGEALDAVATLHPAIEIPDSRYDDFTKVGDAQLIADNACAHYFVLGAAAPEAWRSIDLVEHQVVGTIDGRLQREGRGANVLGDPREALAWLVNELSSLGITLRAGEVVTTGTCLVPLPIEPGDRFLADFGALGRVRTRLGH
jgi:2-keto-4-pentenoate hydratase